MAWNIDDDFDKIFERIFKQLGLPERLDPENPNLKKWSYGYSMTRAPDGKPVIREWGTDLPKAPLMEKRSNEPLSQVDIDRANRTVRVIVELPGLMKESIKITGTETSIRITASNELRSIDTEIPVSAKVDPKTAKATYNNGVLDVTLELIEETSPEGIDIHIN
jgi:HSP20 family protein